MRSVLDDEELLRQLVDGLGSPLSIVLPQQAATNVAAFRETYRRHRLDGAIHFAHKANRSSALVRELAATEARVDVASLGELQHALGAGFTPDRIMATGPKDTAFLWLAARTGVTVNADSIAELAELATLIGQFDLPAVPVLVRLSGFSPTGRRSRFGVGADDLDQALDLLAGHTDRLRLAGLAHHLDTVALAEKAMAFEGSLAALDRCRERGFDPRSLDVGGGFGVDYLADAGEWERYTSELAQAVLGRRPPLTWDGHGYGLRNEAGRLRGTLGLYPAHRPLAGPAYLAKLLETPAPVRRRPLGTLLLEQMYALDVEPGRALLDQCGLVLARVLEVTGDRVRLALNARDVSLEEHGVLMDPVLVGSDPRRAQADPGGYFLLGNLCLEADLITRRKVFLPAAPRPGDLLAFVNTAGYFMDFSATRAIHQPAARKVAVFRAGGRWRWCLDEQYWPVHPRAEAAA